MIVPMTAMVGLTMVVWVRLFVERIGEIRARRISVKRLASARELAQVLQNQQASDNLRNLFEVPVLFYVLCLSVELTHATSPGLVAAAWGYVGLRALHSLIHCTYNNVNHRFAAYFLSCLLLFGMWGVFTVRVLLPGA